MWSQLILAMSMILLVPSTRADIKDFIIENENDLKRFGLADMEEHYEDDLESDWMPNSCGGDVGFGYPYSDFMNYDEDAVYDFSQIDPSLLREILHQMKYDPRFEHLLDHLNEENILNERQISYDSYDKCGENGQHDSSNFYVDLSNNFYDEDNNYEF